jgi:hypothetical protein
MARRRKDLLLHALHQAGEGTGGPWHASLAEAVAELDPAQARWTPSDGRPCAWALVRHVTHWKRGVMRALDQDHLDPAAWRRADWGPLPTDDAAWRPDRDELARVSRLLAQRLAAADDALLDRELPGFGASIAETFAQLASHDAYHAGQVRALQRLRQAREGEGSAPR